MYKSTDFGRTYSKNATSGNLGGGRIGGQIVCIRGQANQLLQAGGNDFGNNSSSSLMYSTNAGITWNAISGTYYIWQVAIGKAKPGGSGFPAVYVTGLLTNGGEPGVFRCDDFDGARTWIRLDNIRKVSLVVPTALQGDPDTWGSVYVGCEAGYVAGTIS